MTTIVAVAGPNSVHLAADKRITPADMYRLDNAVCKVITHQPDTDYAAAYIGIAGTLAAAQALGFYLESAEVDFGDVAGVYRTVLAFRQDMHTNQLCLTDKLGEGDFAVFPMELLIVNEHGRIFTVHNYGEVVEHETHTAIGSGMAFALGALHVSMSNPGYTAEENLINAMSAASAFDPATGEDYDTYEIQITASEAS